MSILINGLMRLKKQYGRYVRVGMPSTVACVMPHVFHGISGDVTVAPSSVVRLSKRLSYPFCL